MTMLGNAGVMLGDTQLGKALLRCNDATSAYLVGDTNRAGEELAFASVLLQGAVMDALLEIGVTREV